MQTRRIETLILSAEGSRGVKADAADGILIPIESGNIVDKVESERDTSGHGRLEISSEHYVTKRWAEINFTAYVKSEWVGLVLKSLLGGLSSAAASGESIVYDHAFTLANNNAPMTLSAYMLGGADPLVSTFCQVSKLSFSAKADGSLMVDVTMIGKYPVAGTGTLAYASDYAFQGSMCTVKTGATVGAATTSSDFQSFKIDITRPANPQYRLGNVDLVDIVVGELDVNGEIVVSFEDETNREAIRDADSSALLLQFSDAVNTIGTAENPQINFTLPKITYVDRGRPEGLDEPDLENLKFEADYDITTAKMISVDLVNLEAGTIYA